MTGRGRTEGGITETANETERETGGMGGTGTETRGTGRTEGEITETKNETEGMEGLPTNGVGVEVAVGRANVAVDPPWPEG
jgi:hypothetical protein